MTPIETAACTLADAIRRRDAANEALTEAQAEANAAAEAVAAANRALLSLVMAPPKAAVVVRGTPVVREVPPFAKAVIIEAIEKCGRDFTLGDVMEYLPAADKSQRKHVARTLLALKEDREILTADDGRDYRVALWQQSMGRGKPHTYRKAEVRP